MHFSFFVLFALGVSFVVFISGDGRENGSQDFCCFGCAMAHRIPGLFV